MSKQKRNVEKAKRAANHPERPGETCEAAPGRFTPVVDLTRCEGKADCAEVCPYDVFEIGAIDDAAYRSLPVLNRLKLRAHGKQVAHTPRADACQACGMCVVACPEHAIALRPTP